MWHYITYSMVAYKNMLGSVWTGWFVGQAVFCPRNRSTWLARGPLLSNVCLRSLQIINLNPSLLPHLLWVTELPLMHIDKLCGACRFPNCPFNLQIFTINEHTNPKLSIMVVLQNWMWWFIWLKLWSWIWQMGPG